VEAEAVTPGRLIQVILSPLDPIFAPGVVTEEETMVGSGVDHYLAVRIDSFSVEVEALVIPTMVKVGLEEEEVVWFSS